MLEPSRKQRTFIDLKFPLFILTTRSINIIPMNAFNKVEELRDLLKKQHPSLDCIPEKPQKRRLKALSVEPTIVRPTIKPSELAGMLQYSSKHKNIKEINYGPVPKRSPNMKVKVQSYEIESSLDCFMKHIATKSFEKYKMERVPGFRKADLTEVSIFEGKKKIRKKKRNPCMNVGNLEIFGQVEVRSVSPKFQEKNLKMVEEGIKRNVRSWYLQEKRKIDMREQLIDHFTFRFRNKVG